MNIKKIKKEEYEEGFPTIQWSSRRLDIYILFQDQNYQYLLEDEKIFEFEIKTINKKDKKQLERWNKEMKSIIELGIPSNKATKEQKLSYVKKKVNFCD
jgi:hypothetical protein